MKAQYRRKINIVDSVNPSENHIVFVAVFNKIEIGINVLQIAFDLSILRRNRWQIEKPLMVARQPPVLPGAQMVKNRPRLLGKQHAHVANPRVYHARQGKINDPVAPGKGQRSDRPPRSKLLQTRLVPLQIKKSHDAFHASRFPSSQPTCCAASSGNTTSPSATTAIAPSCPRTRAPGAISALEPRIA